MPSEIEAAQNFPSDILRGILGPMLGDVKRDDANRVAVLSRHQIADRRFEIGPHDIGLDECEAKVGPVIVDDDIFRSLPLGTIDGVQLRRIRNSQQRNTGNLSTKQRIVPAKSKALEPQSRGPTGPKGPFFGIVCCLGQFGDE